MGSGIEVHFGLQCSSDAASSRWAMRATRTQKSSQWAIMCRARCSVMTCEFELLAGPRTGKQALGRYLWVSSDKADIEL